MKPKYPLTQPFENLPQELPIYPLENALLPGGELPLEIAEPRHLSMFFDVLRSDQLIGMIQPMSKGPDGDLYKTGCAGRVRQYRERKDGRINVMLTGVCRYNVKEELPMKNGYRRIIADWSEFKQDYETQDVAKKKIDLFMLKLRDHFERHRMQIDWDALNKLHIEDAVNNLVLVLNLSVSDKQLLLESPTIDDRMELFSGLLEAKSTPIWSGENATKRVN